MDIKDFLLARIAEDEVYAYHALGLLGVENPWWKWADLKARFGSLSRADAQHIERHGPRRILAECAAKRAIIDRHATCDDVSYGDASTCPEVSTLAAVYSDHPDYQQEWALNG